ncbi:MAG: hypothetical protein HYT80_04825 [Euryarchaeota archaeon]|nr:hypothetical protein [Euryarchaeota archaeon]
MRAALLLSLLVLAAIGSGCSAGPRTTGECRASPSASCKFECAYGDYLRVEATGPGEVFGIASCAGFTAACQGTGFCEDAEKIDGPEDGSRHEAVCSASKGQEAWCRAGE